MFEPPIHEGWNIVHPNQWYRHDCNRNCLHQNRGSRLFQLMDLDPIGFRLNPMK